MSRDARGNDPGLVVDWIACDGYGLCSDLAPDLISLDPWRYPIVADGPVPRALVDDARRAVDCCPMKALSLRRPDRHRLEVDPGDRLARFARKAMGR